MALDSSETCVLAVWSLSQLVWSRLKTLTDTTVHVLCVVTTNRSACTRTNPSRDWNPPLTWEMIGVADLQNLNIKLLSPFQLPIQTKTYFSSKIKLFQNSLWSIQILNCWSFSVYGETDEAALCNTNAHYLLNILSIFYYSFPLKYMSNCYPLVSLSHVFFCCTCITIP